MAEWLGRGLQNLVQRFDSARRLHIPTLAWVAKLVDARDLKSLEAIPHAGSSPAPGTIGKYFHKFTFEVILTKGEHDLK